MSTKIKLEMIQVTHR